MAHIPVRICSLADGGGGGGGGRTLVLGLLHNTLSYELTKDLRTQMSEMVVKSASLMHA